MTTPRSCDTFVALPPATADGHVVFGKNSDRPSEEVQEVIHVPAMDHPAGSKVQCTYIEIDQVAHTHGIILSRPSWLWGAEMGANEHGVCIGNEAVWTKLNGPEDEEEKLLGMDLVRLGLERSQVAREALDVMTQLLSKHGQGGFCSEDGFMTYHNSFLISDRKEAWILETAGNHWAAEQVTSGVRNISNQLTIRTKLDAMSPGLKDFAQSKGWWSPADGDFDFAKVFTDCFEEFELKEGARPCSRQQWGTKLLKDFSQEGNFTAESMFQVLRDERSGICMSGGGFTSTGSQVSVLPPGDSCAPCCHWFTATPNPAFSFFKPFIFTGENAAIGDKTTSPTFGAEDPVKKKPRFQTNVDRRHELWTAHQKLVELLEKGDSKGQMTLTQMHQLEAHCAEDMKEVMKNFDDKAKARVADIFQHMVNLELNFYK